MSVMNIIYMPVGRTRYKLAGKQVGYLPIYVSVVACYRRKSSWHNDWIDECSSDASTKNILQAHEETVQQYGRLTEDMQRMNATVHHLMNVLHTTKQGVEDQLSWITSLVGGTENTIQKVYSCVLHACYFFVGMVSASFLQVLMKNLSCKW